MKKDTRGRKWQITINNPEEKGYSHSCLRDILAKFSGMLYWCMSDEIGDNGTYHTHIYFVLNDASRFSTIKKRFDGAHIEMANGTNAQNRDYVFKLGKWEKDRKKETNLSDTHEEFGELPVERQGARNDLEDLYSMIKQGMTNYEIIEQDARYMLNIDKIERVRQILREEKYKNTFRCVDVTYVYGETGTGKTRKVMEQYGYENVFRVTDYKNPFDNYKGQDVIVFEEFRSSLKIQDMLNYLDGYPLELPCRYNNKVACFTKVYIITNIELRQQYVEIQRDYVSTWDAFLRRIKIVRKHLKYEFIECSVEDYFKGALNVVDSPFNTVQECFM